MRLLKNFEVVDFPSSHVQGDVTVQLNVSGHVWCCKKYRIIQYRHETDGGRTDRQTGILYRIVPQLPLCIRVLR